MGLFSRKKSDARDDLTPTSDNISEATTLTPGSEPQQKKSLYRKYQELKKGPGVGGISDEDFQKATGMTREEHAKWAQTAPGVAGGQAAGELTAGGSSGIGLTGAGSGLGGWGYEAGKRPQERYPVAETDSSSKVA